jgi:hypothetical protein
VDGKSRLPTDYLDARSGDRGKVEASSCIWELIPSPRWKVRLPVSRVQIAFAAPLRESFLLQASTHTHTHTLFSLGISLCRSILLSHLRLHLLCIYFSNIKSSNLNSSRDVLTDTLPNPPDLPVELLEAILENLSIVDSATFLVSQATDRRFRMDTARTVGPSPQLMLTAIDLSAVQATVAHLALTITRIRRHWLPISVCRALLHHLTTSHTSLQLRRDHTMIMTSCRTIPILLPCKLILQRSKSLDKYHAYSLQHAYRAIRRLPRAPLDSGLRNFPPLPCYQQTLSGC